MKRISNLLKRRSREGIKTKVLLDDLGTIMATDVDVRVILPAVGNHGPINRSNALAANAMLEQRIRVYVYPGMSHVKAAIFDGWACLGSANWDKLSFRINKELNIAIVGRHCNIRW